MVGRGRKWDFTGRKITFLIYCATQTGQEGPELTPCASQLSLQAAWGWGHKQGAKGSRVMVHDGPKVPLVNGKVRHRSTKSISWSARREHEAGWLTRGNGGGCNATYSAARVSLFLSRARGPRAIVRTCAYYPRRRLHCATRIIWSSAHAYQLFGATRLGGKKMVFINSKASMQPGFIHDFSS